MWSSDPTPRGTPAPRPKASLAFVALLLALPLAGCFQPLYGEAAHPGLTAALQAIAVDPIPNRVGHYLGNDLTSGLNGTGSTVEPKYRLTVTTALGLATPTVTSQIQMSNAATVTLTASFKLTPADGGDPIIEDTAETSVVYDRTEQQFANLRAERDAEIRLAKAVSDEIVLRLAAKLGEKDAPAK